MINVRQICALLIALSPAACGDDIATPITVLVVDQGIDMQLPVFRNKVAASYTIVCAPASVDQDGGAAFPDPFVGEAIQDAGFADAAVMPLDGGMQDGAVASAPGSSLKDAKAELLAALAIPDESCQLVAGIEPVPSPLADLDQQRKDWNRKVFKDVNIAEDPLLKIIQEQAGTGAFHGSSTAGIIAHNNPNVRMLLVNRKFAEIDELIGSIRCPSQAELDEAARLLGDPDVVSAYAHRPRGAGERALVQAAIDHDVKVVNESFGPLSRYAFARILFFLGCDTVDLRGYFTAMSELLNAEANYLPAPRALVIRSAGNETALLNSTADDLECRGERSDVSRVGSYDVIGYKSAFTNFGACVDVFAPGEFVVGPLPGDWWLPQSGTSFAAPLVTRLVSIMMANRPFDAQAARAKLHELRRPDRSIPRPQFPEDLLYLPGLPSPLALTVASAPSEPEQPRITQAQWHKTLWPLRLLQRR